MSDVHIIFAKSMAEMQLPRKRLLSFRRSLTSPGDSPKIPPKSLQSSRKLHAQKNSGTLDQTNKTLRKKSMKPERRPEWSAKNNIRCSKKRYSSSYTLQPSHNSEFLDPVATAQLDHREKVLAQLEGYPTTRAGKSSSTRIEIWKLLELFPTSAKSPQQTCYFDIKNTSEELIAYQVTASEPSVYDLNPSTGYVPPRRSMTVSLRSLELLTDDRLDMDTIVIRWFCGGVKPAHELMDFIHPEAPLCSSATSIRLVNFVQNPCSVLPAHHQLSTFTLTRTIETVENDPWVLKYRYRLKLLRRRNRAEKLFDRMQSTAVVCGQELESCRKLTRNLGIFLNLVTYLAIMGILGFALYLATHEKATSKPEYKAPGTHQSISSYFTTLRLWLRYGKESMQSFNGSLVETFAYVLWIGVDTLFYPFNFIVNSIKV